MTQSGRPALGAFGFQILRPTWIGASPTEGSSPIAWRGLSALGVPIVALRKGFIIFEFDQSDAFRGGAVPPYILPPDRNIPKDVTLAEQQRDELAYRRFEYMN